MNTQFNLHHINICGFIVRLIVARGKQWFVYIPNFTIVFLYINNYEKSASLSHGWYAVVEYVLIWLKFVYSGMKLSDYSTVNLLLTELVNTHSTGYFIQILVRLDQE